MTKLFIGGFPLEFTELDIVMLVGHHGDVSTIKVVRDKKTKICKGYAFLEMVDRESAERVIEAVDGTTVDGRVLSVSIRPDEPVKPKMAPKFNSYNKAASTSADFSRPQRPRKQF